LQTSTRRARTCASKSQRCGRRGIDRVARDYSRKARCRLPAGKTPARVIKQRFKDQILHDVVHDLIPRAIDNALQEKGLEAIDTPMCAT